MSPELTALQVGDPPDRWQALGFTVEDGRCEIGGITLHLDAPGRGITGWAVTGLDSEIDGLPRAPMAPVGASATHPNGAIGIDHVVVTTPDFDRTASALEAAAMPLRRIIARSEGNRMGFRRLGPATLELVEAAGADAGPARFWGLVVTVEDLDALAEQLGEQLGSVGDAVQPGRRIATLHSSAGLGQPVAFMTPEPMRPRLGDR